MNTSRLQISAKHLGQLALPNCCERCFWLNMRLNWKLPGQFFAGIFSSIDAYTKRIVGAHYAALGRVPPWLPIGEPLEVPHWSRFSSYDAATRIFVVGAPDEMMRLPSSRLGIYDYKTARLTTHQDELGPLYAVQLNTYAWLAGRLGLGDTEQLALVYCEPVTENCGTDELVALTDETGFAMRFAATLVPVDIHQETIPQLLARVREIVDAEEPPPRPGCKDCQRLEALLEALGWQTKVNPPWTE